MNGECWLFKYLIWFFTCLCGVCFGLYSVDIGGAGNDVERLLALKLGLDGIEVKFPSLSCMYVGLLYV